MIRNSPKIAIARLLAAVLCALAAPLAAPSAGAQTLPQRPVKLLIPFAAGGNIDVMGRLAAQRLSEKLGLSIVVENRVGGNGTIAVDAVARAAPDGATLLWASTSVIAIFPAITKVNYDPQKDLAPISLFQVAPQVLVVTVKFPAQNLQEFIGHVKAQKETMAYAGGGGPGSASNLMMALFLKRAGINMNNVSYRGTAPALVDVIAGHIPTMFLPMSEALPQARSNLIRMLGVTSAKRAREAPEVPTIAEQGFEGYDMVSWTGLMAPPGTPKDLIDVLSAEIGRALADPSFVEQMLKNGVDPAQDASPAAFAKFIGKEIKVWGDAVQIAGVKLQ